MTRSFVDSKMESFLDFVASKSYVLRKEHMIGKYTWKRYHKQRINLISSEDMSEKNTFELLQQDWVVSNMMGNLQQDDMMMTRRM